jgi:hypothetical protein
LRNRTEKMILYNDSFLSYRFCAPLSSENRLGQIDWGRVKEMKYFHSMLNYTCYVVEIIWNIEAKYIQNWEYVSSPQEVKCKNMYLLHITFWK